MANLDYAMLYRTIAKTTYKICDFISWQRSGSLILSPSFQRRDVWKPAAKSYLLDTVVRGFPIPIIFLREKTDLKTLEPIREVVDGQQRLRTLIGYISADLLKDFNPNKDLVKVGKKFHPDISNKTYSELTSDVKKRILGYDFSVHILPSDTEDREVLQIFSRMNATGVKVNKQELRNAEYYGEFKTTCYDLAYEQLTRWRQWGIFSETDIARMIEVEESSDLILLMLEGLHGRSQAALDKIYKQYEESFPFKDEVSRRFRTTIDTIDATYGKNIRASSFSRKALFNTLFTLYYDLLYGLKSPLSKQKPNSPPSNIKSVLDRASMLIEQRKVEEELLKTLRGATSHLRSRELRLSFLQDTLKDALKSA